MKRLTVLAAFVAVAMWGTTAFAGEKIKLPTGPANATRQVTTAIQHGSSPITNVNWARRAWRNGWGYGGYYAPYYSYRPYYGYGYAAPYWGGYYTRPYYGYSYYSPGWYGGYSAWGPGVGVGVGPLAARVGGWYW